MVVGLEWTDKDGDRGELLDYREENPTADEEKIAYLRVTENSDEAAVLVPKDEARRVIAWLTNFYELT